MVTWSVVAAVVFNVVVVVAAAVGGSVVAWRLRVTGNAMGARVAQR